MNHGNIVDNIEDYINLAINVSSSADLITSTDVPRTAPPQYDLLPGPSTSTAIQYNPDTEETIDTASAGELLVSI